MGGKQEESSTGMGVQCGGGAGNVQESRKVRLSSPEMVQEGGGGQGRKRGEFKGGLRRGLWTGVTGEGNGFRLPEGEDRWNIGEKFFLQG